VVSGRDVQFEHDEDDLDDDPEWDSPYVSQDRTAPGVAPHDRSRTRPVVGTAAIIALAALLTFGILTIGKPSQPAQRNSDAPQVFPTGDDSPDNGLGPGEPTPTSSDEMSLISLTLSSGSSTVAAGSATQLTITVTLPEGATEAELTASGVPAGVSASFTPSSVQSGQSSTLTVSTSASTPIGPHVVTVQATAGGESQSEGYTLTVVAPSAPTVAPTGTPPTRAPTSPPTSAPTGGASGLLNGGFESGLASWTTSGSVTAVTYNVVAGTQSAKLGADTPTNDSKLSQTFTATGSSTISFWYRMICHDIVAWDWFTVTLKDVTSGQTVTLIAPMCHTTAYQKVSAPLIAGHRYQITFVNHDDDWFDDASWSFVDEVAIGA
jgi:hypothetical protein